MRDISGLIGALASVVQTEGSAASTALVTSILRNAFQDLDDRTTALESKVRYLEAKVARLERP